MKQDAHRGFAEEGLQKSLVTGLLGSTEEPGFISAGRWAPPASDCPHRLPLDIALKQIGEPVGVQRSYFHRFTSICPVDLRAGRITTSNAGSGVHWPTRPEKSALGGRPIVARVSSSTTN